VFRTRVCFSLGLELMMGIFSNFEGVKSLEGFMEVLYDPSEYKFT
jgi:hypothetical protein